VQVEASVYMITSLCYSIPLLYNGERFSDENEVCIHSSHWADGFWLEVVSACIFRHLSFKCFNSGNFLFSTDVVGLISPTIWGMVKSEKDDLSSPDSSV
jgi:hypothetical protein